MKKPNKKNIVAILAGVAVAAGVTASAASLGGVSTEWLGANSNQVASPITGGLNVTWDTVYNAGTKFYVLDDFTVETIDSDETLPVGAEIDLTLQLTGNDSEAFSGSIGTGGAVQFTGTTPLIPAHAVEGVSVVVTGGGSVDADASRR